MEVKPVKNNLIVPSVLPKALLISNDIDFIKLSLT